MTKAKEIELNNFAMRSHGRLIRKGKTSSTLFYWKMTVGNGETKDSKQRKTQHKTVKN